MAAAGARMTALIATARARIAAELVAAVLATALDTTGGF
jgi:hypothetical protein